MTVIRKPISTPIMNRWINRDVHHSVLESIGRYTRFVLFSKVFFAGLSAIMIITIIVLPVINADEEGLRIAFSTVADKQESLPVMTNPTFQGVDDNNQPYMITAQSALQHDANTIILNSIQADLFTEDGAWLNVNAKTGTLNTQAKHLTLSDEVKLFHDQGYEFVTPNVAVDMNKHQVMGDQEIAGRGPIGALRADRFMWDNNKRILQFSGNVKLTIEPKR